MGRGNVPDLSGLLVEEDVSTEEGLNSFLGWSASLTEDIVLNRTKEEMLEYFSEFVCKAVGTDNVVEAWRVYKSEHAE